MKIVNKEAPSRFTIVEKVEAGIVLSGQEVKAIREGHADLTGSHVKLLGSEAFLINAKIYPYKYARTEDYHETRSRKLLLHKKELRFLTSRLEQGNMTIVPLTLYAKGPYIKVEIGLAKGKKQYDKRQELKKKELQRDAERELKKYS